MPFKQPLCVTQDILVDVLLVDPAKAGFHIEWFPTNISIHWCPDTDGAVSVAELSVNADQGTKL